MVAEAELLGHEERLSGPITRPRGRVPDGRDQRQGDNYAANDLPTDLANLAGLVIIAGHYCPVK
jgi:hypothetical protein